MRRFARYTLPLLLWLCLIFTLSGDRGSAENTRPLVRSILRRFAPALVARLTPDQVERVDFNLRKSGHVLEYLILAVLAYRAVRTDHPRFRSRHVLVPMLLGILYAASDEWHQSFIPSRWGVAADVLYDTFGTTLGTLLCQWREQLDHEKARDEEQDGPTLLGSKSEPA